MSACKLYVCRGFVLFTQAAALSSPLFRRLRTSVRSLASVRFVRSALACAMCLSGLATSGENPRPHYNRSARSSRPFGCALCSFVSFVRPVRSFLQIPCRSLQTGNHKKGCRGDHLGDLGKNKDTKKLGDLCNLPALGVCGVRLLHHCLKTCKEFGLLLCTQIAETSCSRVKTFGGTCFLIFSAIAIAQI